MLLESSFPSVNLSIDDANFGHEEVEQRPTFITPGRLRRHASQWVNQTDDREIQEIKLPTIWKHQY